MKLSGVANRAAVSPSTVYAAVTAGGTAGTAGTAGRQQLERTDSLQLARQQQQQQPQRTLKSNHKTNRSIPLKCQKQQRPSFQSQLQQETPISLCDDAVSHTDDSCFARSSSHVRKQARVQWLGFGCVCKLSYRHYHPDKQCTVSVSQCGRPAWFL